MVFINEGDGFRLLQCAAEGYFSLIASKEFGILEVVEQVHETGQGGIVPGECDGSCCGEYIRTGDHSVYIEYARSGGGMVACGFRNFVQCRLIACPLLGEQKQPLVVSDHRFAVEIGLVRADGKVRGGLVGI